MCCVACILYMATVSVHLFPLIFGATRGERRKICCGGGEGGILCVQVSRNLFSCPFFFLLLHDGLW